MASDEPNASTLPLGAARAPVLHPVRRFRLILVEGPEPRGLASPGLEVGHVWESSADRCTIGSHESNDLVLPDPTVSRFHCEVRVSESGARVRDLGSTNRTVVDGVTLIDGFLRNDSLVRVGSTVLRFQLSSESNRMLIAGASRFGSMVGTSVAMRKAFSLLERAAASNATVLLEGETGTGKGQAAASIRRAGARRDRPFVVVDCSAIPPNLMESELFGHVKGSFTGAMGKRIGAFEEASGGTIFLDELGELPLDLQPKLLGVLETREIRRVGQNQPIPVDVRVIAATNRDLRAEVNRGQFRSDLYFRVAVLRIPLPSLRERPEDLPALADEIFASLGAAPEDIARLRTPALLAELERHAWPGNVRELRNYLERCLVFQDALPVSDVAEPAAEVPSSIDTRVPLTLARERAIADFERRYLEALLREHDGKTTRAAVAAGVGRVHLYKLLKRYGFR